MEGRRSTASPAWLDQFSALQSFKCSLAVAWAVGKMYMLPANQDSDC